MSEKHVKNVDKRYKVLMNSYFWPRTLNPELLNYGYNCTSCHSVLIGRLMYLRFKNELTSHFPSYVVDQADRYFGPRLSTERPIWQKPVIKVKPFPILGSTMFKGTGYVESKSKKNLLAHTVRFASVEHKNAPEKRRLEAFRYMFFKDDCEDHNFKLFKTVPFVKRAMDIKGRIIDNREATDYPPPNIEMSICNHSWAIFFYLIGEFGVESYGIDEHVDSIIKFNMGNILDRKYPFYELDKYLMEETVLLQEFKAWERKKL